MAKPFMRRYGVRRLGRVLMYLSLVASGSVASVYPSQLVLYQTNGKVGLFWALCLAVSAAICLYGSATDRWIGEYTGIPLLSTTMIFYGLIALKSAGHDGYTGALYAYGFLILGFAFGLIARWRDVQLIKKHAEESATTKVKG
jgi:hypothetical protein